MNALLLTLALLSSPEQMEESKPTLVWEVRIIRGDTLDVSHTTTGDFFSMEYVDCLYFTTGENLFLMCLTKNRQYIFTQTSHPCTPNSTGYLGVVMEDVNVFEAICEYPTVF